MQKVKLLRKSEVADGTMAFYFEKPARFSYEAGQHADLAFPKEGFFSKRLARTFSFITIAEEEEIGFATRMRKESEYKQKLAATEIGAEMEVGLPEGDFTLPKDSNYPIIFLAGGIGITPFYGLIKHSTINNTGHHITLFYSNRNLQSTAFLKDLHEYEKVNLKFNLVSTMTDPEVQDWVGERGYITADMLKRHCQDWEISTYYIAGPFEMVKAMKKLVSDMGVPASQIKIETFVGY